MQNFYYASMRIKLRITHRYFIEKTFMIQIFIFYSQFKLEFDLFFLKPHIRVKASNWKECLKYTKKSGPISLFLQ